MQEIYRKHKENVQKTHLRCPETNTSRKQHVGTLMANGNNDNNSAPGTFVEKSNHKLQSADETE